MFIKGKIDSVLKVHKAQDNKTNIFIASQILGASMHAFQYIQFSEISFGGIDLNLDKFNYEGKFRRTVLSKIEGKQEDYDGCLEEIGMCNYNILTSLSEHLCLHTSSMKKNSFEVYSWSFFHILYPYFQVGERSTLRLNKQLRL